jgi:ELWxxDGT repeat protein
LRSILLLLAFVLAGCSAGKNLVDIGLDVRIQGISTTHPVMVFAQEVSSGKRVSKSFASGSEVKLRLPNGAWSFSFIAWGGSNPLEGQVYCYATTQTLTGGAVVINATMASTNCNASVFGDSTQYEAVNGLLPLVLHHCKNVTSATSDSSTCEGVARGFHRSYRIGLMEVDEINGGVSSIALESACISAAGDTAEQSTSLRLPIGAANGPFAYSISGYESGDCAGTPNSQSVKGGLVSSAITRAFVSAATSTKLFVQSEGAIKTVKLHEETGGVCDFASPRVAPVALDANDSGGPYVYAGNRDGGGNNYNLFISDDLTENSGTPALDPNTNPSGFEGILDLVKLGGSAYFTALAVNSFTRKLYQVTTSGVVVDSTPSMIGDGTGYGDEAGVQTRFVAYGTKLYYGFKEGPNARRQLCFTEATTSVPDCSTDDTASLDGIRPIVATTGGILYVAIDTLDTNDLKLFYLNESTHLSTEIENLTDTGMSSVNDHVVHVNGSNKYFVLRGSPSDRLYHVSGASASMLMNSVVTYYEPIHWGSRLVLLDGTTQIPHAINYPSVDNIQTFASFTFVVGGGSLGTQLLAATGDYLYFSTNRAEMANYHDLYVLQWSTSTITKLTDHSVNQVYSIRGALIGSEFYYLDSTNGDTWLKKASGVTVTPIAQVSPSIISYSDIFVANSKIYFHGNDGANGTEPWVSDGTAAGTFQLADLTAGAGNSSPDYIGKVGDYVIFRQGQRFYRTKGVANSTVLHLGVTSMEGFGFAQPLDDQLIVYFQQFGAPTKSYTVLLGPNP